jgi:hypothetical protein
MIKMKSSGNAGNFAPLEPVPAGNHIGILYQILEIGTIDVEYQGETKRQYKVSLSWELPDETAEFPDKETGQTVTKPRVVSKEYTLSSHEKSGLRNLIESWRGRKFKTDEEAEAFDLSTLLGKGCMIQVNHHESGDRTYARIGAVTSLPKAIGTPPQYNDSRILSYSDWDWDMFNKLPEWFRTKVETTPEFQAIAKTANKPVPAHNSGHADGHPAPARDAKGTPVKTWKEATQKQSKTVEPHEPIGDNGDDLPF